MQLVVAERQDRLTGVFWTREPKHFLSRLGTTTQLGRVEIRPCAHAARVLAGLRKRLEASIEVQAFECFWTDADFEEVVAALDEYDLERGALKERAGVKVDDRVTVAGVGRGRVTGFTRCGRVIVRIEHGRGLSELSAIAPRSQVKPILRAVHP